MTESSWIAQARRGDAAGWEALAREHQAAAFRLAYLLVGDADDAEDIVQEALIRAYRSLDRFDAARPFRPWLLRITANVAHNRRRTIARYLAAIARLGQTSVPGDRQPDGAPPPAARELWQAVRRLSTADRQVIYLRYFMDLPVAETAETLGVAPGTVKSRLSRALERLRAVVEDEFPTLREEWPG